MKLRQWMHPTVLLFTIPMCVVFSAAQVVLAADKGAAQKTQKHGPNTTKDESKKKSGEESHHEEHAGEHEDEHGDKHGDEHGDHEEEEGSGRIGPGKAIIAVSKKDGFQLSKSAVKTLGLSYLPVSESGKGIRLPASCAVYFLDEVGIYRLRNRWFKLIEVELVSNDSREVQIKTDELKSGDEVVKSGVPLLRAAELESQGGSGDGHGH